jgi:hypothetical protein
MYEVTFSVPRVCSPLILTSNMGQADVRLVASGLRFNMVCAYCEEVLLRNLPSERAAYVNAETVVSHKTVCEARETRREHLIPLAVW